MPLSEFLNQFGVEGRCREYMAAQRWQDVFVCPKCGHKHSCRLPSGLYPCTHSRRQTCVTAETVLHHSHISLSKWYSGLLFRLPRQTAISVAQLSNHFDVIYKTHGLCFGASDRLWGSGTQRIYYLMLQNLTAPTLEAQQQYALLVAYRGQQCQSVYYGNLPWPCQRASLPFHLD